MGLMIRPSVLVTQTLRLSGLLLDHSKRLIQPRLKHMQSKRALETAVEVLLAHRDTTDLCLEGNSVKIDTSFSVTL